MSALTEAEAKTKWCPFARVHEQGTSAGPHNRSQSNHPQDTSIRSPIAACCIAAACMAWRPETQLFNITANNFIDKGTIYLRTDETEHRATNRGFCGLAGQP